MRPTLLDEAFRLLDDVRSPQDFTIILHFRHPLDVEALNAGAKSAGIHFGAEAKIETPVDLEGFVNKSFDLQLGYPIKQMLSGAVLATRFHHAAADGMSAALWLGHQLSVAYGVEPRETAAEIVLRRARMSVRRSAFAYDGACDRLWTASSSRSGTRGWISRGFACEELQRACRRAGGFTYSDLLATCALEVFVQWNHKHVNNGRPRVGLWLPMNVRSRATEGFGNGTSRIRLYAQYPSAASLVEKAREVRRQVAWSTEHGEWAVPDLPFLMRLPVWITRPMLLGYLNRPAVDMATGIFTHADRWGGASEAFKYVDRIECIGLLHARQNFAINGATHRGQTWLTFTYDTGLMRPADAEELARLYEQQVELARSELL